MLLQQNRGHEALQKMLQAARIDPSSAIIAANVGLVHLFNGQGELALDALHSVVAAHPKFAVGHYLLGQVQAFLRVGDCGVSSLQEAINREERPVFHAFLGYAHGVAGNRPAAQDTLARLAALARSRYVSPFHQAVVHLGLEEYGTALALLGAAIREGSTWRVWLSSHPMFAPVRETTAFEELLQLRPDTTGVTIRQCSHNYLEHQRGRGSA
jgi:serine/threonine-protein kinase